MRLKICITKVCFTPKSLYWTEAYIITGEGHFDDGSGNKVGTEGVEGAPVTPAKGKKAGGAKTKGAAKSHRRKSTKERLAYADGTSGNNFDGEDDPMVQ